MRAQTIVRLLVLAAIIASVAAPATPPVQASPTSDIWTHYYDCNLNQVGEKFRGCGSLGYNQGQLSGKYKEIEACSCEGGGCNISWYEWNGSSWVALPGPPTPSCP